MFYLIFCVLIVLSTFSLSLAYCSIWFIIDLLRRDVIHHLVDDVLFG